MALDMTQFHEVFFDETAEHLSTMESLLIYLDPAAPDPELMDDIGRAAHSIKGSGGTFGFAEMADVAQEVDRLIARVRRGEERLSAARISALQGACGVLRALLAGHRGECALSLEAVAPTIASLRDRAGGVATPRETAPDAPPATGGESLRGRGGAAQQQAGAAPRITATVPGDAAGELLELARRTATASNEVMAMAEAAGSGNLAEITEAVRMLGEAIEQNAALVERAAENAESLQESLRELVRTVAGLALSSPGRNASRHGRPRPLPKVRRAGGKAWPEY